MRGFPLLNLLIVIAFFALAWWPLQELTGQPSEPGPESEVASEAELDTGQASGGEAFSLRITSSHPIESLSLAQFGEGLLEVDGAGDDLESEHPIGRLEVPPEGVEFWLEAQLQGELGEHERPAIRLELIPESLERDPKQVTVWGRAGEAKIEMPAVFLWAPGVGAD